MSMQTDRCVLPVSRRVTIAYDHRPRRRRIAFDDMPGAKKRWADFSSAQRAEKAFAKRLVEIAKQIGAVVTDTYDGTLSSAVHVGQLLASYSEVLARWAPAVLTRMHTEVAARNKREWFRYAEQMGVELRREIETAPTGEALRQLLSDQVHLISSLPTEAAQRVHTMTVENLVGGERSGSIIEEIMRTGEVTKSRARLIARTETARTSSILTQVRAQSVGSTHFRWETSRDSNVRHDHKILQGKIFAWDDPPIADQRTGTKALPGSIWNCRCFAVPLLSED